MPRADARPHPGPPDPGRSGDPTGAVAFLAPSALRHVARCPHCGLAVEGDVDTYCCAGCELAAAIIRDAGLEEYYERREEYAPRPTGEDDRGWAALPVEHRPDGSCEARLVVDGLRCASCVWVVERVLERTPGVLRAHVSYASGRASLAWDPARTDLPALAHRISALGYRPRALAAEPRPDRELLVKLGVAVFAAANVMTYYEGLYAGWWHGIDPAFAALFRWASLALATPVAIWCASPFFLGAWTGLRHRLLHMDVPIALGVGILYLHGLWATLTGRDAYLDSLTMLVALLLAGRFLEARGRRRAADAAIALAAVAPRTARRATPGGLETIPSAELRPGDLVDVGAGEELPADGVVASGAGAVRLALVTGESEPVPVTAGERVVAGAVLLDGALTVRVEAAGDDTLVQRMATELRTAADRALRPAAADRIAPWFTAATLVAAALTLLGWALARGAAAAIAPTVAVLVVACPCALALARPLAAAAGLGAAARRGLLLRSGDALLAVGAADVVALDKTGTATEGALIVVEARDDVLRIAAGLERYSHHPVARAIVEEAARRGIPLPRGEAVREVAGRGILGRVDGRPWELRAGDPGVVVLRTGPADEAPGVDPADPAPGVAPTCEARDAGAPDRECRAPAAVGSIRLADALRPETAATVAALEAEGVEVALLTGDHERAAARMAADAGIRDVVARIDPEGKRRWIEARRAQGQRVLFAGDGLNDGPALAAADAGIAMATGVASSLLVADGVATAGGIAPILAARRAARAARRMITAAQRWSIGYNVVAVGAAAAGRVNPLVAAVLMPLSSAVVLWCAARVETLVRREERCRPSSS